MEQIAQIFVILYFVILLLLSLFGVHRYFILYLYYRYYKFRPAPVQPPDLPPDRYPTVTVQLPIFNERYVVDRIIKAVGALRYPSDRLTIQVLDDSTDETSEIAHRLVEELRPTGLTIDYLHRTNRTGFKAGALQEGLFKTQADLVAVFDADFIPDPEFLLKVVPYFQDSAVAMVQTRWGYLNREYSLLTRVQALLLDGHFVLEHSARFFSGRFFNFNGTAGIWRREAILAAGGWQGDTLTEDLDLSYRAQMQGAKFIFLPSVICPSELPVDIAAFKRQQFRWAKGAAQVAKKLLPQIWRSDLPLSIKFEATVHLTSNVCYLLMVGLTFMLPFSIIFRKYALSWHLGWLELMVFIFTIVSISVFYLVSQRELYPDWRLKIKDLPLLFSLGIGMCLNNAKAVYEALLSRESAFERTPKYGIQQRTDTWKNTDYAVRRSRYLTGEWLLLLYLSAFLVVIILKQMWLSIPLFVLFTSGYALVWMLDIRHPAH